MELEKVLESKKSGEKNTVLDRVRDAYLWGRRARKAGFMAAAIQSHGGPAVGEDRVKSAWVLTCFLRSLGLEGLPAEVTL